MRFKTIPLPRRDEREVADRLADQLFLLYNIANLPKQTFPGKVMLTKLSFLSQISCQSKKINAPHYGFFRYTHGPMTRHLYYDLTSLCEYGLINQNNRIKRDGHFTLKALEALIDENDKIFRIVDNTLDEYGKFDVDEIKDFVYNIKVKFNDHECTIKDLPMHTQILNPLPDEIDIINYSIIDEWQEDIFDVFGADIRHQLMANYYDTRPFPIV